MTIQRFLSLLYTVMIVATVVMATFVLLLMRALTDTNSSQEARHQSYLLANELRQSSDDLTRMARTYAVTGDPLYEEWYWEILAIRNGEEPRPEGYERIFWDLVTREDRKPRPSGETVALRELMQRLGGFTAAEMTKLQEAQNNSDALVWTETIVMNAVKGLYDDGTGNFVVRGEPDMELARRLMHDSTYHADKVRIMRPIDEFFQMMSARTEGQAGRDFGLARRLVATIMVLSASLIGLAVASLVVVFHRVGRPISLATALVKRLAADVGVGASTEPVSRAPGVRGVFLPQDEIGDLATAFNDMAAGLGEARRKSEEMDWLKTGLARLDDSMRGDPDLATLASKVISEMASYLEVQVGALYLAGNGDGAELSLLGSYAYTKRKNLSNRFSMGEGLVGQAALEKCQILIRNVPDDYVKVTSGLGEHTPRFICVTPFLYEDRVKGVVEIGTLKEMTDQQLEYLAQAMPALAMAVQSAESRVSLAGALEDSQKSSERLREQQEELRATNEELEEQAQMLLESEGRHKAQ